MQLAWTLPASSALEVSSADQTCAALAFDSNLNCAMQAAILEPPVGILTVVILMHWADTDACNSLSRQYIWRSESEQDSWTLA